MFKTTWLRFWNLNKHRHKTPLKPVSKNPSFLLCLGWLGLEPRTARLKVGNSRPIELSTRTMLFDVKHWFKIQTVLNLFVFHALCKLVTKNSPGWIWTNDNAVNSRTLYHWATEDRFASITNDADLSVNHTWFHQLTRNLHFRFDF